MEVTEEQARRAKERLVELARSFAADPAAGRAAGYEPEERRVREPAEIGRARGWTDGRSPFAAWLYAVARRNLPAGSWRVDEGMGSAAELVFPVPGWTGQ